MAGTNPISSELFKSIPKGVPVTTRHMQLRPGQIVSGKVLELYPNQKASILLGNQQLTAQLQAPLNLHKNYWFQVQSVDQLLRLKVIVDRATDKRNQGVDVLLKSMGLSPIKNNTEFLMKLIDLQIPFNKESVKEAINLLDKQANKKDAQSVLTEMIKHNLPIKHSIYSALLTKKSTSLTEQVTSVLSDLSGPKHLSKIETGLRQQLELLQNNTTDFELIELLALKVSKGEKSIFNLFKLAGLIPSTVRFEQWEQRWMNWQQAANNSDLQVPFNIEEAKVVEALQQLKGKQLFLSPLEQQHFLKFAKQSEIIASEFTNKNQINQLKELFQRSTELQRVYSKLSASDQSLVNKWLKEPTINSLYQLVPTVKNLANSQVSQGIDKEITELLVKSSMGQLTLSQNPRDQFVTQLKYFLNFSGLLYENELLNNAQNQTNDNNSLKSMLLQIMQNGSSINTKSIESLVHLLNGIQLTALQDNDAMLQLTYQIPGNGLGLSKDLELTFESQKDQTNQINPDFCHVIFYLQLEKLGDTIIDMHIQKRMISMTVLNDQQKVESLLSQLRPTLTDGLRQLNYQLSSIQFRNMTLDEEIKPKSDRVTISSKGVDYKI
ncbi:hypothetical protein GH741_06065 [Aquibacillus halophilus]|uniref:Flagellar hook-length control protein-like C-terminal domain-containing protein n=1 Tax=Aquibacillus halophilus TaxID=930132 RepID=A0A6A8D902_9BACI|nr:hypothetical protein [Aquibacillus halophilus]MRH42243.1 hypothetical protein [Aquibacillus halophilus]